MDDINRYRIRKMLIDGANERADFYSKLTATPPFLNICVLPGIQQPNEPFILQRLDAEARKRGDFIIITDIKCKFSRLCIKLDVRGPATDFDYEDFLEGML